MDPLTPSAWMEAARAERRRTGGLLLGAAGALAVLVLFGLVPIRRDIGDLAAELEQVESDIPSVDPAARPAPEAPGAWPGVRFPPRPRPFDRMPDVIERERHAERARKASLMDEWISLRSRVATFSGETALKHLLGAPEEGRIDFKVSLFNARTRMAEAAREAGMAIPADLGVPETIGATESAEARLWQLAASVRFLEICMAAGVSAVESIEIAPPVLRPSVLEGFPPQTEYPLRVRVRCRYEAFLDWVRRLGDTDAFFGLHQVQIARDRPGAEEPVVVSAMVHATVFRDPQRRMEAALPEPPADLQEEQAP